MSREHIVTCNMCRATSTEHYEPLKGWKKIEVRDAFGVERAILDKGYQIDLCPHCYETTGLANLLCSGNTVRMMPSDEGPEKP